MMRLKIDINGIFDITDIYVVRISPKDYTPEIGEICTYELYENGNRDYLTKIKFPYGDGNKLAIKMLEEYTKLSSTKE